MAASAAKALEFSPNLHAGVSDEFRELRAAASKAQDAATWYETQTTGLLKSISPLSTWNVADQACSRASPQLPLITPTVVTASAEPHQEKGKDEKNGMLQDGNAAIWSGVRSLGPRGPRDSKLGDVLANTEDCHSQPAAGTISSSSNTEILQNGHSSCINVIRKDAFRTLTQTPGLNQRVKSPSPTVDFQSHKTSAARPSARRDEPRCLASHALSAPPGHITPTTGQGGRSRKSLSRQLTPTVGDGSWFRKSPSESLAPRTGDSTIQGQSNKIPKAVAEWINGGEKLTSVRDVLSPARSMHEPTPTKGTPKAQLSQSRPPAALTAVKDISIKPRLIPKSPPIRPPVQDIKKTGSQTEAAANFQGFSQSIISNPVFAPFSLANDKAFIEFFRDIIYPYIKASIRQHQGKVSADGLVSIGKDVANKIVTRGFRNFVRECSYEFDDAQKKKVQQFIESFTEKAVSTIATVSSDEENSHLVPKLGSCVFNGLGALPSESSNQALPSDDLLPSCPPVPTDASMVRNGVTYSESTGNPTKDTEGTPTNLAAFESPKPMLSSAKVFSPGSARQSGSGAAPQRNGYDHVSKEISSNAARIAPERNKTVPTISMLDDGSVVFSGPWTDPEHTPLALAIASSCRIIVDDHRIKQQVATGDSWESRAQNLVSGKIENEGNHLLDITSAQLHSEQNRSADPERQSDHGGEDIARPSLEETWSEEDGDQVLASWLSAKPTKDHYGQAFPTKKDNLRRLPAKGPLTVQTNAVIHSSSIYTLKDEISPSAEYQIPSAGTSVFSSVSEDRLLSLPPTQDHPFLGRTSRSSAGLSDFPSARSTFNSTQPEETREHYTMAPSDHLRSCREDPSRRRNRPPQREEVSSPQQGRSAPNQEGLPERQEGILQGREKPSARPAQPPSRREQAITRREYLTPRREQTHPRDEQLPRYQQRLSNRQQGSSQHSASPKQPVIAGCALKKDDPSLNKTLAEVAIHQPLLHRPYNTAERDKLRGHEKNNDLKHVDFSDEECEELLRIWLTIETLDEAETCSPLGSKCRTKLQECLRLLDRNEISEFVGEVRARSGNVLQGRRSKDITAFLLDLVKGVKPGHPKLVRIEHQVIDPCHNPLRSTASLLRHREIGLEGRRFRNLRSELQLRTSEQILPWRSWKGASGDVVACAWAPQSTTYAVGAAAPTNDEDLQYNRPRNLLLGDLIANTLEELPDHRMDRPKPETISIGPNSTQAVYDACDPMVYMTVSSLHFSCDGSRLYTASHDKTVKIWDVSSKEISCLQTIQHDAWVLDLDMSPYFRDVFAAATKTIDDSIHVYFPESDDDSISPLSSVHFQSPRAKERPQWLLYPECLRWGRTANTSQLLLAGFQQWGETRDNRGREGQLCLWNVHAGVSIRVSPSSQSIFTATWHPTLDLFATGGSPSRNQGLTHPSTTRSVVRTWDVRILSRFAVEYECPAIDMQDVIFNPLYPNIVSAGCTDSATYVWDFRKPDNYLHKLRHGRPLSDWDHTRPQEEGDPGVMMTVWGQESSRLYTGSSDGIVKCWDIMRAPEDVLIRDVGSLGAGIQSGAFSPDFSHLLVGDADGGVHILTSAPVDVRADGLEGSSEPIKFIEARDARQFVIHEDDVGTEGIRAAQELLDSGRLVMDPVFGVGKGPNYTGPYAKYARKEKANLSISELLPEFEALQPFSNRGRENLSVTRKLKNLMDERRQIIEEKKAAQTIRDEDIGVVKDQSEPEDPKSKDSTATTKRRLSEKDPISGPSAKKHKHQIVDLSTSPSKASVFQSSSSALIPHLSPAELGNVEDNTIPESEMVEENHWWPRMDEEVFKKLGVKL